MHSRLCAIRMDNGNHKVLFINVYMPYEGNEDMTDKFADKLTLIESLINDNLHVVVGGDLNVDFNRRRLHTLFCVVFVTTTVSLQLFVIAVVLLIIHIISISVGLAFWIISCNLELFTVTLWTTTLLCMILIICPTMTLLSCSCH